MAFVSRLEPLLSTLASALPPLGLTSSTTVSFCISHCCLHPAATSLSHSSWHLPRQRQRSPRGLSCFFLVAPGLFITIGTRFGAPLPFLPSPLGTASG